MPLSVDDMIEVVSQLASIEDLKVTVSESLKAGALVGSLTIFGGLLGGPIGLAVGGAVGGCIAAASAQGKFKPVPQVLMELPPEQKLQLARRLAAIFKNVNVYDVVTAVALLNGDYTMGQKALLILKDYITNELRMELCQ